MILLPGELLQQRYQIVTALSSGSYGSVYRAWDIKAEADVVLKEYRPIGGLLAKLRKEGRRLAEINHPQLPRLLDHFQQGESYFFVSQYIDGVDLQSLVDRYGPLPTDRIISWLQGLRAPLAYLHAKEQPHLDIKPANIRVRPDGTVFLVDSGLLALGVVPGTLGYASPEQRQQTAVTPASDIYSLGGTLFSLLTGEVPPDALRLQSGLDDRPSAREVNPNIEPYLSLTAIRAMSIRPDARYQTVEQFSQALERPSGKVGTPLPSEPRRTGVDPKKGDAIPPPKPPPSRFPQIQQRGFWILAGIFGSLALIVLLVGVFSSPETPVGGDPEAATATVESQVLVVLTAMAPTPTPTIPATLIPTATPAPLIDQTGMRMLFVPGGIFRYGNDDGDPDEGPAKLINLDPFFIDETEVTNGQYQQCVEAGECSPPTQPGASYHDAYFGAEEYGNYPVVFVNWFMADQFCRWRDVRLPTEAEWERAAGYDPDELRRTLYPWGEEFVGENLNYCDANCPRAERDISVDDGHTDTAPVGSYVNGRSYIGAYDLLGNVMEWVGDWYDNDYYSAAPNVNPRGPVDGEFKALRGGSWFAYSDGLTVTSRGFFDPSVSRAILGFRCATDAD